MNPKRFPHAADAKPKASARRSGTLALAVTILGACGPGGASPIPQPPILAIPIDRLTGEPPTCPPDDAGCQNGRFELPSFRGTPGSVPGGATVRVTDLDSAEQPFAALAASDGSFVVVVPVNIGDELRFEVFSDGNRSPPTDAIVGENEYALTASPRFDCLELDPGFVLSFDAQQQTSRLRLSNGCAADVVVESATQRLNDPNFSLETPLPLTIPRGASVTIDVSSTPGQVEDVLLLDITSAAETIRYPISLTPRPALR